jgi:solute carrier family 25 S-adenosylmethionine transporter 26
MFIEYAAAGAIAGLAVDIALYPIDTLKTRVQSRDGFFQCGGFRGIYRGLLIVSAGSVPCGALFFTGYEITKAYVSAFEAVEDSLRPRILGAIIGESLACLLRVPVETIKQQMQKGLKRSLAQVVKMNVTNGWTQLYMGFGATAARDIPFGISQMVIFEALKDYSDSATLLPIYGLISGGSAAFFTTPLDVAKTRIMLRETRKTTFISVIGEIVREEGFKGCFRGAALRVLWIGMGGSVFFTTYELAKGRIHALLQIYAH